MSLPKSNRVVQSAEFRTIYDSGTRVSSRFFAAFLLHTTDPEPTRIGFTIPRAVGKAVARNRIRRRMREACRVHLAAVAPGWKIVFNPRRVVLTAGFDELCLEVARVLSRCVPSSSSRSKPTSD